MPLIPENAMTVSDWRKPVTACVLETVTFDSSPVALAVQISETPKDVLARLTIVQPRPPPAMVSRWPLTEAGPAEGANATSTSPGTVVLNAAVVRLFNPSEDTILSTAGPVGATALDTVTETGAALATLPARSRAVAVSVCAPSATGRVFQLAW